MFGTRPPTPRTRPHTHGAWPPPLGSQCLLSEGQRSVPLGVSPKAEPGARIRQQAGQLQNLQGGVKT